MGTSHPLNIEMRPAESPLVETIWRSHSHEAGPFLSIASSHWEIIIAQYEGRREVLIRGPETQPTLAHCPPDGEWLGIQFKHGVFMPHLPVIDFVNSEVDLSAATGRSFWLHGSTWELPTFENADTFVARLIQAELLACDPIVEAALQAQAVDLSERSVQRRFLRATGLTHGAVSQIERAHYAVALLRHGVSILDTVEQAGYFDQPHLTRSLKRLIGQTPAQLVAGRAELQLSFSSVISSMVSSAAPSVE